MSHTLAEVIDIGAPVDRVYEQWVRFEEFPRFMKGVIEVTRVDETHHHWIADIGGISEEWDTEVTEKIPNQRVCWRNTSGATNAGSVYFETLSQDQERTRVTLVMEYEPHGFVETLGDLLGILRRRVEGDLERFKTFVET